VRPVCVFGGVRLRAGRRWYLRGVATLRIVIASTRPGRVGLPVGEWFEGVARDHGGFDVEVTDLAALALPFLDEPHHPRLRQYTQRHTFAWSEAVEASDAFAFVIPEYNYGITAPIKNAIDYLHQEWQWKPVGFVSYGGIAAGTRALQMMKQVVTALNMVPLFEAVSIPFVRTLISDDGAFEPTGVISEAAVAMLDQLVQVEAALRPLRAAQPV
jgi:NAD(P)H-dependent FMN reductase